LPAADRIIATALAGTMGGTAGVSMMLILLALITFAAALCARETRRCAIVIAGKSKRPEATHAT
jgi:hypothetical protein